MIILKKKNAFTLVELLVAAYILLIGMCGTFLFFISSMNAAQTSWGSAVAVSHAQSILEDMQQRSSLFDIVTVDWDQWLHQQPISFLPEEKVNIRYTNAIANPLEIFVTITWKQKNTLNNVELATILTK